MKLISSFVSALALIGSTAYAQITTMQTIASAGNNSFPSTLIQAKDGNLYFTTAFGGGGKAFQMTLDGQLTLIHQFGSSQDGSEPDGGLVEDADGNFHGIVAYGPTTSQSAIFQMTPTGEVTVHEFLQGSDGGNLVGGLTLGRDGYLYGVGYRGGTSNNGTVVRLTLDGSISTLHSFDGTDGSNPMYPPIQMIDGTLTGTAIYGGDTVHGGTAFQISPSGVFTKLHAFPDNFGAVGLIQAKKDGNFYGWATNGGSDGCIFKMTPNGIVNTVKKFSDGYYPYGGLIEADDGFIYGVTRNDPNGGAGKGTAFRFDFAGNFETLHNFVGGAWGSLMQASDRNLYGTLQQGEIFKITLLPPRLANISTRGFAQQGDKVMIGGFIITGPQGATKKVAIRGIGPSLGANGAPMPGRMLDPSIELHLTDGSTLTNDNWQDAANHHDFRVT